MLLEKDLDKFGPKKVIIEARFKYSDKGEDVKLGFEMYYSVGERIGSAYNDATLFPFAKEVKEQIAKADRDILHTNADDDFVMGSEGYRDITHENDKRIFLSEIYSVGKGIKYPVFFQLGEEYLFINELNFFNYDKEKEGELTNNKLKELYDFVSSKMYGEEYEELKKQGRIASKL